jgi:hypothetical protein
MAHKSERLDRTAFFVGTHDDAKANFKRQVHEQTPAERLSSAWVRVCRIHGVDPAAKGLLDRTAFSMRQRER